MGIYKLINRFLIIIMIFIFAISLNIYFRDLEIDEFYGLTLKEAIDYSDNGNPIDVFLDFKK